MHNKFFILFLIFCCLTFSCHAYSCNVGYDKLGAYYGATQSCPSGFVCYRYDILNNPNMGERLYGFTPTSNCESWKKDPVAYPNLICCTSDLCNNKNAVAGATSNGGNGTRISEGISVARGSGMIQFIYLVAILLSLCGVLIQ